jgi:hypothetical protein
MSTASSLVCPECGNKYPLKKQLIQCPVCEINLTTPAQSSNINKRKARDIRDNSGPVILGDGATVYEQPKSNIANYEFFAKSKINELQLGLPVVKWITLWAFLIWLLNTSGSIASILSFLRFEIKLDQIKQIVVALNSYIFDNRLLFSAIITGLSIYFIVAWINKIRDINNGRYVHIAGSKFYKKSHGTVLKGLLNSKCPHEGCSGSLTVSIAPSNQEGFKIIGRCDKKPRVHTYDFDPETLQGGWVKLTDKPKPNNNKTNR